eukprot:TRINITY_DN2816_c0_g1_i1.p2 TRINITY_DN2816_c0_g1~~TRINITY_DN2816_c0_g1_i1.p2  ORF type:complete len:508 (+),score=89.11 TRINITY_DN2816_c0_g1_i1:1814-3337(+)
MKIFGVLLALLCIVSGEIQASQTIECDICEVMMDYVLLNPNTSHSVESLIDQFCDILPGTSGSICKQVAHEAAVLLQYIESGLSAKEEFTGFDLCTMIDRCSVACCQSADFPEQVHISFVDDPHTSLGVTWVTLKNVQSIVKYGTTPSSLNSVVLGKSKSYTSGGWLGYIHNVEIEGLQPGTTYYYSVGSDLNSGYGWSPVFSFKTESNNSPNEILRIVEIGDMGAGPNSDNVTARIIDLVGQNAVDFIIHNGDISYADGYQGRWDSYFRKFQSAVANTQYMVTPGNHEIAVIGLLGLPIGYIHRFMLPGNGINSSLSNMFYSWNYGLAHFIALDTESVEDTPALTDAQVQWLENDLKNVNRKATPWIIVFGHRPFYCSNGNGKDTDCGIFGSFLRQRAEALFNTYKVDIVLGAHKHNYERMYPILPGGIPVKTYQNPGAPVYIVNGAGGNREGTDKSHYNSGFSASYIAEWGYGMFTIYNSTHLDWDYYIASDNSLGDHVTLVAYH